MPRKSTRNNKSKDDRYILEAESCSVSYGEHNNNSNDVISDYESITDLGVYRDKNNNTKTHPKSIPTTNKSLSALHNERIEQDRKARMNFLLEKSEIFSHFLDGTGDHLLKELKDTKSKTRKRLMTTIEKSKKKINSDDELIDDDIGTPPAFHFQSSPKYITGGTLRDYQIRGLNWLISLYYNGINGILADEMGLGKTLQTIALLGYMKMHANNAGPHIVICPKSTLSNWANEFYRWCPSINICTLAGTKDERRVIMDNIICKNRKKYDVIVTSFEVCINDKTRLKKLYFGYLIIDEAHRIKNEKSKLSEIVREFNTRNRLLLTGTPLQNNLHELWALLNFLLPDIFSNAEDFDSWFNMEDVLGEESTLIKRLHSILQPFLLRRLKSEVEKRLLPKKETKIYVGLSAMQRQWYTAILLKDIDLVNSTVAKANRSGLLNIIMQLRKCCNHPYLFNGNRPEFDEYTDEHLIQNSGKLVILDKLLKRLNEDGSRVLIFSQMTRMLDLLEEYIQWKGYEYCRIDGQTNSDLRKSQIDTFNAPDSPIFIFLLSTRAGGLGINLATADIVILYDSDWNPQMDLQAMDRAHRIGQKKQVKVFRFITENTIEERVIERAEMKLHLDNIIIQQGRLIDQNTKVGKDEILTMIRSGADKVFASKDSTITDEDIDVILARGENKTAEMNEKLKSLNENALRNFSIEQQPTEIPSSVYDFEGENYRNKKKESLGMNWINPPKRERRVNYAVDKYYNDIMKPSNERVAYKPPPKPAKFPIVFDFQFYPKRLYELLNQELYNYRHSINYKELINPDLQAEEAKRLQLSEQAKIDAATVALTEKEYDERDELLKHGFSNWSKRDFCHFVKALEKHGTDNLRNVIEDVEGKAPVEVKAYYNTFMNRMTELEDYSKILTTIERGRHKINRRKQLKDSLDTKFSQYEYPLYELKINYGANKGKIYTEDEDRYLLCLLYKFGLDSPNVYEEIVECIRASARFRFDWFFKSRTPMEIRKRCNTLINFIEKEISDEPSNQKNGCQSRNNIRNIDSELTSIPKDSNDPSPHTSSIQDDPPVSNLNYCEDLL